MKSQNTQSLTLSEIRQAVARGWCATENAHKVMDSDLAFAVANEVYEALRSTATAAQGEPVATKWAMYFSGEPENPQFKPGFMDNWCLYSDVLSVQHECDSANKSYAERDSATAGHKPYVARQVFVFANPPEPAGVVEAGTVGVSEARIDVDELWATVQEYCEHRAALRSGDHRAKPFAAEALGEIRRIVGVATQPPSASPVAVPEGFKLLKDSTHDERSYEGGDYYCMCCTCLRQFSGQKRQWVCKVCATPPALPDAGLDSQKGAA